MDAPDHRLDVRDPDHDMVDPIGPPVLETRVRCGLRALALSGAAVGATVVAQLLGWGTMTPPLN